MSEPKTITINDVKYIREDSVDQRPITTGKLRIAVLNRGWNIIGYFEQNGDECTLTRASVIRRWGTTKGLGEIASGGPTQHTVLDKCPDVKFHILGLVFSVDCVEEKWAGKL